MTDIETTEKYWDCECEKNFIHPKMQTRCSICGAVADEQPDSRVNEVGMKVPGTDYDVRTDKEPEEIEMVGWSVDCRYCNGVVKMMRDPVTFKIQPDHCYCLMCGQRYFVKIEGSIEDFELNQWKKKGQTFAMELK